MNDPGFKTAAYKIAEETPPHLGQPTSPPIHWLLEGANLRVLLADGRTVRAPIVDEARDKPAKTDKPLPSPKPSSPKGKK